MGLEPYRNHQNVFQDETYATTPNNSGALSSAGYSYARVAFITASTWVDTAADATVGIQGSMDGTNWSATIQSATATASGAATYMSAIADIRCYNHVRLVYTKNGVTAGTFTAHIGLMRST